MKSSTRPATSDTRSRRISAVLLGLAIVGATLGFAACSIVPEPKPDPTRFYVLSTSENASATTPQPSAPTLQLKRVDLATYLRSRPFIVRQGNNELEFRDFARWGEPLESGIARVVREELLARGTVSAVSMAATQRGGSGTDYSLSIRVLACEGGVGGNVHFRAVWELTDARANATSSVIASGDFRPSDLRWDGKSESSLAAQLSQAVIGLAAEVAAAIPKKS